MNKKHVYMELAHDLCEEFSKKQSAMLLSNLNKRNTAALDVSKEKMLRTIREELGTYEDEKGRPLSEDEKDYVISLVQKELFGYGVIDDLIAARSISDIKLYR